MANDLLLKALFDCKKRENRAVLCEELPEDLKKRCLDAMALTSVSLGQLFFDPFKALSKVHPSWYNEVISYSPVQFQPFLRELLDLKFGPIDEKRSAFCDFFLTQMVRLWPDRDMPSIDTLEEHPLFFLLGKNESQLDQIAGLLALADILESTKKIIDKKKLHQMLELLEPVQQQYLTVLLRKKSEMNVPFSVGSEFLKSTGREAKEILLKRGRELLFSLLSGQDDLFYWHFLHQLPSSFAEKISQKIVMDRAEKDRKIAERRFNSLLHFLKKGNVT
jgi:hypothetical protein